VQKQKQGDASWLAREKAVHQTGARENHCSTTAAGSRAGLGIEPAPVEAPYSFVRWRHCVSIFICVRSAKRRLLKPREEIELGPTHQERRRRAREQMIKANLRLVVKIARDYEGYGLRCSTSSTKGISG